MEYDAIFKNASEMFVVRVEKKQVIKQYVQYNFSF